MKIEGSGSISQRHGSADPDPDPHQNVMDPQHCYLQRIIELFTPTICHQALRKPLMLRMRIVEL
jgi:hypothetical protein